MPTLSSHHQKRELEDFDEKELGSMFGYATKKAQSILHLTNVIQYDSYLAK